MVDKNAMFDELSKKFPPGNYFNFCNKMDVDYNEAKQMLTRCKENYTEAIRDLLAQWDLRKKGVSREDLEKVLDDADIGGLCSIVRKHYEKAAATQSGDGDGAVHSDRNQHIPNQPDTSDGRHVKQKNIAATAPMEDDGGDVVYDRRGPTKSQAQPQLVAAAKSIDEAHGRPDNPAQRQSVLVKRRTAPEEDSTDGARGGYPTANITVERTIVNKEGDKSKTIFIMTGVTKEHFLGIGILCVMCVVVYFQLNPMF